MSAKKRNASKAMGGEIFIPDKLYFRIGEVSALLGVETYVLRYWETEFPSLAPKKSGTGHRLYRRKDVELLLRMLEVIAIQALSALGNTEIAKRRAKAFVAAYPNSPHTTQIRHIAEDP